jgi:HTH-type transcriptional regulator/antitoxin HipB
MIKNQKQASITKARLAELINTRNLFEVQEVNKTTAKYRLGINSISSLIEELQTEIHVYEGLTNGTFHVLQAKSLTDIPNVLIAARLAQKMSHKDLGELVGLKEQQIQRYEATDYETASWPRIVEIAMALNLHLKFEKNIIMPQSTNDIFEHPDNITKEQIEAAKRKVQKGRSLLMPLAA